MTERERFLQKLYEDCDPYGEEDYDYPSWFYAILPVASAVVAPIVAIVETIKNLGGRK